MAVFGVGAVAAARFTGGGSITAATSVAASLAGAGTVADVAGGSIGALDKEQACSDCNRGPAGLVDLRDRNCAHAKVVGVGSWQLGGSPDRDARIAIRPPPRKESLMISNRSGTI